VSEDPASEPPASELRPGAPTPISCPSCRRTNWNRDTCERCGLVFGAPPPGWQERLREVPAPYYVLVVVCLTFFLAGALVSGRTYRVVGRSLGEGRPVVILLHGYGASGTDLVPLAERLAARATNASFVVLAAPHGRVGKAWMQGGQLEQVKEQVEVSRQRILDTIADVEAAGVAPEQIYLGGFSQGAMMSLEVACGAPIGRRLGGLILMSGGWPSWPGVNEAGDLANLVPGAPVLVAHGRNDTVLGFSKARDVAGQFEGKNVNLIFLPFEGGHKIPPEVTEVVATLLGAN